MPCACQTCPHPQPWLVDTGRAADHQHTMKFYVALVALFALFAASAAADDSDKSGKNACFLCIKSYIDCFNRFGVQGCTDKNAEHYTYCRECTGVDPIW